MGSSDWYIILLSNTVVNCHGYTEVRRMTENMLVGKAICIGELYLGRSEILRSLRYYVWAHSQGHHIDCDTHTSYMQSVGCLWLCSHTEYLKVLRIHMQARTHMHTHNTRTHTHTHTHTELYVTDVMSLVWCPHIVSQASQNFKPSKIQSTYVDCFAYFGVLHHQGSGVLHQLCLLQLQIMVRWAFSS